MGGAKRRNTDARFLDGCIFYGVKMEAMYLERLKKFKQPGENAFFEFGQDLIFGITTNESYSLRERKQSFKMKDPEEWDDAVLIFFEGKLVNATTE